MTAENSVLLERARLGDRDATDELFVKVYDELRALAAAYLRRERDDHTLQPTALVHEAYLQLIGRGKASLSDRAHFFRIAAQTMRRALVEHARRHGAEKRGGGRLKVALDPDAGGGSGGGTLDALLLEEAISKLEKLDERKARVVELRFLAGLTLEETGEALGISGRTVREEWYAARAWLRITLGES